MDELHTLLQFMVFSTRFFSPKIFKSDMCQKISLSIRTSLFGHVQHDWIVQMDLVILTGKVIDKMIVNSGPFDCINFILKLKSFFGFFLIIK
jgi:hypothetical protein